MPHVQSPSHAEGRGKDYHGPQVRGDRDENGRRNSPVVWLTSPCVVGSGLQGESGGSGGRGDELGIPNGEEHGARVRR
jgi:hypothetical protein